MFGAARCPTGRRGTSQDISPRTLDGHADKMPGTAALEACPFGLAR